MAKQDGEVVAACTQPGEQLVLFAIVNPHGHAGVLLCKRREDAWQVQRCRSLITPDIDLAADHIVVGQCVLFELVGLSQQVLRLTEIPRAGGGQRHAMGLMPDEQLHIETLFQALDGG